MKPELIPALIPELFQTERSAVSHGRREARRWGDTPPARALLAVAAHAETWLVQWRSLAAARDLNGNNVGQAIGEAFSIVRDRFADALVRGELSYRGTLLGMRHGVDVIHFLRDAALAVDDAILAEACAAALAERTVLVGQVAHELSWLAAHPEEAARRGTPLRRSLLDRRGRPLRT